MRFPPRRRARATRVRMITILTVCALASSGMPRHTTTVHAQLGPVGSGFTLDAGDLRFIYQQILISQDHAAGLPLVGSGPNQIPEVRLPFGLRTVDGSWNHLPSGTRKFGAADQVFPRIATPGFRAAEETPA